MYKWYIIVFKATMFSEVHVLAIKEIIILITIAVQY